MGEKAKQRSASDAEPNFSFSLFFSIASHPSTYTLPLPFLLMANPASTSSPFSMPLHAVQDDDVVLDRLSAASQSKIYPTKCSRTEMPLRRILLVTR